MRKLATILLLLLLATDAFAKGPARIETQAGRLDLITKDGNKATEAIIKALTNLHGYFLEITDEGIVCKVPVQSFATLRQYAARQGTVLNEAIEAVDVAEERRRLLATLAGKRAMTTQYMRLLTASASRSDIVQVQLALMDLTAQIEGLAGRLQLLDHQLQYATLVVNFDRGARPNVRFAGTFGASSFKWVNTVGVDHLIADFGRSMGTKIEGGAEPVIREEEHVDRVKRPGKPRLPDPEDEEPPVYEDDEEHFDE